MNKNVNVLAVMDDAAKVLIDEQIGAFASLLEVARDEVAELIDKVDSYVNLGHSDTAYRELSAALARVKGV